MNRSNDEVKTLFKILTVGEALALNEAERQATKTNLKEEK